MSGAGMHPSGGEELRRRGDRDALDPQITADDVAGGRHMGSVGIDDDMQVETLLARVPA